MSDDKIINLILLSDNAKKKLNTELLRTVLFEYVSKYSPRKLFDILYLNFYNNILEMLYYINTLEPKLMDVNNTNISGSSSNDNVSNITITRDNKNEFFGLSCKLLWELIKEEKYDLDKLIRNYNDCDYLQELLKIDLNNWLNCTSNSFGKENMFKKTILFDILTNQNLHYITEHYKYFTETFKHFSNKNNQYIFFGAFIIENFSKTNIVEFLESLKNDNNDLYTFINISMNNNN